MNKSPILKIIIALFLAFFIIAFGRLLFLGTASSFAFEDFLQMLSLSSKPVISPIVNLTITADWGVFNFLRGFLNLFSGILTIIYFVGANLINVLGFIFHFISYIFGIA